MMLTSTRILGGLRENAIRWVLKEKRACCKTVKYIKKGNVEYIMIYCSHVGWCWVQPKTSSSSEYKCWAYFFLTNLQLLFLVRRQHVFLSCNRLPFCSHYRIHQRVALITVYLFSVTFVYCSFNCYFGKYIYSYLESCFKVRFHPHYNYSAMWFLTCILYCKPAPTRPCSYTINYMVFPLLYRYLLHLFVYGLTWCVHENWAVGILSNLTMIAQSN